MSPVGAFVGLFMPANPLLHLVYRSKCRPSIISLTAESMERYATAIPGRGFCVLTSIFLTGGSVKVVSWVRAFALVVVSGACAVGGHASAAMVGPGDVLGPDPSANVDRSLPVGTVVAHETRSFYR